MSITPDLRERLARAVGLGDHMPIVVHPMDSSNQRWSMFDPVWFETEPEPLSSHANKGESDG